MSSAGSNPERFVRENARLQAPPLVPEIPLRLADEAMELWHRTEAELKTIGLPLPFWAFAWAGGQALARYVLDHPETVAGRSVLVLAGGAGLEAIAAVKAGAARVAATDLDPFARAAMAINATANGVDFEISGKDLLAEDEPPPLFDTILLGDLFYEQPMAARVAAWGERAARGGALVLVGDPGRGHPPKGRPVELAAYDVPTPRALEDADVKRTRVWRL